MKRKNRKQCYYCGKPATSGEHVPPKQMFKAFLCDSLTVPSCEEHNSKKSGRDQAVISALLIPLHTGRDQYLLEPEIEQAIEAALPSFERSKRVAIRSPFLKDPPSGLEDLPDLAHIAPSVNIANWFNQLTAGLVYTKIGSSSSTINWQKATVWSPDWFPTNDPSPVAYTDAVHRIEQNQRKKQYFDELPWHQGWSSHPRPYPKIIYSFDTHLFSDNYVMFRHRLYNRYTFYVVFKPSSRTISRILTNP